MKRIRVYEYGGPEVLKIEDAEDLRPSASEVLVRVKAVGVNPYDTYARSGTYGARNPALPFTPGSDAAGIVEAVGEGVSGIERGSRVYTSGTLSGAYAELALCKPSQVQPLPEEANFAEGAAIFVPYATAYRALFQVGHAEPGETVLVHGASGGVGIAAVQFARAAGLTIIGSAGTDEGLRLVSKQGAHHRFNHRNADYRKDIMSATDGRGVDLIVEMLANVNLGHDLSLLANGGRVVIVGSRASVEILPRDLMARNASISGVMLWSMPESELPKIHRAIYAGLENGSLHPIINVQLRLAAAAEAHQRVLAPGALGKIILLP